MMWCVTAIDSIFTNFPTESFSVRIVRLGILDHYAQEIEFSTNIPSIIKALYIEGEAKPQTIVESLILLGAKDIAELRTWY